MGIIKRVVEHYGKDMQLNVCIEELSELIKELCKDKRGQGNPYHIAEEMADVRIIMAQLDEIYHNTDAVAKWTKTKLKRLKQRLNNENRRKGCWKTYFSFGDDSLWSKCSVCGSNSRITYSFCPHCGAHMIGGDNNA